MNRQKEMALMEDLMPLLHRLAQAQPNGVVTE
jgi:hypothetical protein